MLFHVTRKRIAWLGVAAIVVALSYAAIVLTPWSIGPCGEDDSAGIHLLACRPGRAVRFLGQSHASGAARQTIGSGTDSFHTSLALQPGFQH